MEEDLTELTEATYWTDYLKCVVPYYCNYNKQMELRKVDNEKKFEKYRKRDYYGLAVWYMRINKVLKFSELKQAVAERFVELLPPLTLYHFSKASKQVYYHCLNLRGLEFKCIDMHDFPQPYMELAGYDGTRCGSIKHEVWSNYQISLRTLHISIDTYLEQPTRINFVKKYKNLWIYFLDRNFEDTLVQFCDAFFHRGVENVHAYIGHSDIGNTFSISLKSFFVFLDYSKNLKHLEFHFSYDEPVVKFMGDPEFPRIKSRIEEWANGAPNLEIFLFCYKANLFQWHEKKLKRVVNHEGKWYWSNKCDIDNVVYKIYEHLQETYYRTLPRFYSESYYQDVLSTLFTDTPY